MAWSIQRTGQGSFFGCHRVPGQPACRVGNGYWTRESKNQSEEIPDTEDSLTIERVCAIDVANASGKVCVQVLKPDIPDLRVSQGGTSTPPLWRYRELHQFGCWPLGSHPLDRETQCDTVLD